MTRKRIWTLFALMVAVVLALGGMIGYTLHKVNAYMTTYCFNELTNAANRLCATMYETADMDRTILTAMAAILAGRENITDEEICSVLSSYNIASSYISYVEIFRPDGTLMNADGVIRDVKGKLNFAVEAQKGAFFTDMVRSTQDESVRIVRNAVPVVVNGETRAILYGVIRLDELAQKYTTDIYDGHAYVYLLDGSTGDFMLDTWHKSYGNLYDFTQREMLPGFSFDDALYNTQNGIAGNLGFVSKSTGNVLYLRYEPVGINNWMVMLTIEEQYAMADGKAISSSLFTLALMIGVLSALYLLFVAFSLYQAYLHERKAGLTDQTTGLQNRNAYERRITQSRQTTFPAIVCIYIDANGLHELNNRQGHVAGDKMLCTVAASLQKAFPPDRLYRIGGDEFVVLEEALTSDVCRQKMASVNDGIDRAGYSISYGLVSWLNETGLDDIIKAADARMLEEKRKYYQTHNRRQDR